MEGDLYEGGKVNEHGGNLGGGGGGGHYGEGQVKEQHGGAKKHNTGQSDVFGQNKIKEDNNSYKERDQFGGGQVQEHLGGAQTHSRGQSVGFDQNKMEENDVFYKDRDHSERGQEHSIEQSNTLGQDTRIEDNLISSDYRPTNQIIYDQGIAYECLR